MSAFAPDAVVPDHPSVTFGVVRSCVEGVVDNREVFLIKVVEVSDDRVEFGDEVLSFGVGVNGTRFDADCRRPVAEAWMIGFCGR